MPITQEACIICGSETSPYFSKDHLPYPGSPHRDTWKVDYWKCSHCGFVLSKTHRQLDPERWSQLNESWHHHFEGNLEQRTINQPPYAEQALALWMLSRNGIVNLEDCLDYAAGYGTLSKFLEKYFASQIRIFDRYVNGDDPRLRYVSETEIGKYQLVINSAMFEHVLTRDTLDEVDRLVADDGVLMLHTLICERVPKDPDWFYLTPTVHTAFHTNRSLAILMEQWDYAASIYSPTAKSWFLFKKGYPDLERVESRIGAINAEIQAKYFLYKNGFVDYWKGF